ncbi:MAG: cupin domain-containing protein [Elusimicrobiota bacterium]
MASKIMIVKKPWGREVWYAQSSSYVGKIITVEKGKRLSLQFHRKKRETVYSLKGRWLLELDGRRRVMRPGQAADIAPGMVHRFSAPYGRATLLEVSTPQTDDVVRLEDDYGRA